MLLPYGLVSGGPGGWETAGVFGVDALVGWLIGRLADAGYQTLARLLRGSDQARALKQAVTAAVQATVSEIVPSGGEEAERVSRADQQSVPPPGSSSAAAGTAHSAGGIAGRDRRAAVCSG